MIIGTAGHIDHGKTTLVRALTGVDTDRLPEEKRRGITIELGFAPLVVDGVGTASMIDVPGHEAFVRTMVAGATGVDVALLVVAADEGVMPQTREHLAILSLLGTTGGVVALTKCDLVDEEWLALVTADVALALRGTALEGAPIVATSATTGAGLAELRQALGSALRAAPVRDAADAFRMPVDRAFSVRGTGTVVTGTVWNGQVAAGDALVVQPSGAMVRVRGVQVHGGAVAAATPGMRCAVAVSGAELADVARGAWLCGDVQWPATSMLRAEVSLLESAAHPLRPREWIRLHIGTADVGARIVAPGGALQPGERRAARVVLQEPVLARAGDRFVLRYASPPSTVGGGLVVDPLPPQRRAAPWHFLGPGPEALERVLAEAGRHGVMRSHLAPRLGVRQAALSSLLQSPSVVAIGTRVYPGAVVATVGDDILAAVEAAHASDPLGDGLPLAEVATALRVAPDLAERAVTNLLAAGRVERRGSMLARPGWAPIVGAGDAAWKERVLTDLRSAGAEPPDVSQLTVEHQRDPVPILRLLEREGLVVGVEPGRFYAGEVVERLVTKLRDGMTTGREYSPSELRDVLGLSRKYLIPFLEFCDRKRITERRATGRVLVSAK